jgi:hypothetical protein
MKYLILFMVCNSSLLFAQSELLKCLGSEEKRFHLNKRQGPVYELNQKLISEIVQIPGASLKPSVLRNVCKPGQFSESWKLLEHTLKDGKAIFEFRNKASAELASGMADDYIEASRDILVGFINSIQAEAPSAECLNQEIPKLGEFFFKIKALQEDVDMKQIFDQYDVRIFEQLKSYPKAFERCQRRLKKKTKSAVVSDPKKP